MPSKSVVMKMIDDQGKAWGIPSRKDYYTLIERFNQAPTLQASLDPGSGTTALVQADARLLTGSNRSFSIAGTNSAGTLSVLRSAGGFTMTTAGASADQMICQPIATINSVQITAWRATSWSTDKGVIFAGRITAGASVATQRVKIGLALTNAVDTTTDDDQVFLLRDTGLAASAGKWVLGWSAGGVDGIYAAPTSFPFNTQAASEDADFRIEIGSDRVATAWINGELLGSTMSPGATNPAALVTNKNLLPFVGIHALSAAAKVLSIRELMIARQN